MAEVKRNTVKKEHIESIIDSSEFQIFHKVFGKQCVVVALLPNGFTLVGESACVDSKNYDDVIGFDLALESIRKQLWMLEGYLLQNRGEVNE